MAKRAFDVLFSFIFLFVFSPLLLIVALFVKLSSPGPVFYKGLRVGRNYRLFECYKFRTMFKDADQRLHAIVSENSEKKREWEEFMKLKDDPRITPLGRFLRKSSLDELPQFLNVLKGDLSIVGPRPLAISGSDVKGEIYRFLGPKSDFILSIKPGITGLWQTSGRNHVPLSKRRQMEICYVRKRSFALDLLLVLKTIPAVFSSKGAF